MWFIVKTDVFTEQSSMDFLKANYEETFVDFYFPLGRKISRNENGEEKVRFLPVLQGMFFIKVASKQRLERILSNHGYFAYKGVEYDTRTSEVVERTFFTKAHLLCSDSKEMALDDIIKQARIPDEDMDRFIFYNNQIADGIEGLSIVQKRYSDLISENDTIRILSGPMKGWVGVVKQIKNKGKKDRHLLVRFGNNHCLNISNIRQYDMQIEHEAVSGGKSEAVGVWRAIDQLIGYLQAKNPEEDAPATLRQLLADFQNQHISKKDILDSIGDTMQSNFRILAHYFHADKATVGKGLDNLIPDSILRPFLTPTSGIAIPEGKDYAVLEHNGIVEFILRCNLRDFFRGDENEKEYIADKYEPVFDEDYEYYAHFALLPTADGKIKAMTSWGGFYDNYALKSQEEKEKFLADLEAKKYTHLHQVLAGGNPDLSPVAFEKVDGIGGFSITTDVDAMENKEELARKTNEFFQLHPALLGSLTAAAVEVWQGARLLVWRQLLQRYVLLHKVPVADLPSVISSDQEFADCFGQTEDPKGNIQNASLVLKKREASIREFLEKGQLPQAVFRLLSTTLVLSSHFAKDDLYNYIGESFNPDQTCTALFDSIFQELKKNERKRGDSEEKEKQVRLYHAAVCLHKGMVELTQQDSWTYFKFPTFLKQTQAMEKKVRELKKNIKQFKLQ